MLKCVIYVYVNLNNLSLFWGKGINKLLWREFIYFSVYFSGFTLCRFAQSNLTEAGFMIRWNIKIF